MVLTSQLGRWGDYSKKGIFFIEEWLITDAILGFANLNPFDRESKQYYLWIATEEAEALMVTITNLLQILTWTSVINEDQVKTNFLDSNHF